MAWDGRLLPLLGARCPGRNQRTHVCKLQDVEPAAQASRDQRQREHQRARAVSGVPASRDFQATGERGCPTQHGRSNSAESVEGATVIFRDHIPGEGERGDVLQRAEDDGVRQPLALR